MEGLTLSTEEQTRLQTLNGVLEHYWSMREAAEVLGVSERHAWRLLAAYRKEGAAALAHGNCGRVPWNSTPPEMGQQVVAMVKDRYGGTNHTHLAELLAERERIVLSRSTVRRLLVGAGMPSSHHRRSPRHRCRRQRMPQEGMLLQLDGSHHAWLEGRGPVLALMLAVDDATGTVPCALFREGEDTRGYLLLLQGVIERRGIPLAVYTDRHAVFQGRRHRPEEASILGARDPTQFARALRELGVTQVFAHSPEAKGRVERANGTFQDRLVTELRLAGASTLAEANDVLREFLSRFNHRFGVPATRPGSAYRPPDPGLDIDGVLCIKETRRVARDNTVRYHGHTLQLFPGTDRPSYAGARVEVQERLNDSLVVCYRGKVLIPEEAPPLAATLRPRANTCPEDASPAVVLPSCPVTEDPDVPTEKRKPLSNVIWYEDSTMKRIHRDLVKAGMELARQKGKRIGRPRVTERAEFSQRYAAVVDRIRMGSISRRQAAKELAIGYATLKRLLDARPQSLDTPKKEHLSPRLPQLAKKRRMNVVM